MQTMLMPMMVMKTKIAGLVHEKIIIFVFLFLMHIPLIAEQKIVLPFMVKRN